MKVIDKISKEKKNYNIIFHDGTSLIVTENTLIKYKLKKGMSIEDDVFRHIEAYNNSDRFYILSMDYISFKMRTKYEVIEYLKKKDCQEVFINSILERLQSNNYINDEKYVKQYIDYHSKVSKKGPNLIIKELFKRGIPKYLIDQAIKLYDESLQMVNIDYLIDKENKIGYKSSHQKNMDRLLKKFINKGYYLGTIKTVLNERIKDLRNSSDEIGNLEKEYNTYKIRLSKKHKDEKILNQKLMEKLLQKGYVYENIKELINSNKS